MSDITELYCLLDDFCQEFEPLLQQRLLESGQRKRRSCGRLSLAELMTLLVLFHQIRYRQFKAFYLIHVQQNLQREFPRLPSYSRIVELMPRAGVALAELFQQLKGKCTGISIVDSTPLPVCHNLRIPRHKTFSGLAQRGKSSTGWFFGFKLHILINHQGELLDIKVTSGNVDDRAALKEMDCSLFGKLFADKGYISRPLHQHLQQQGVELITKVRKNMQPPSHTPFDTAILHKRNLIETVFDQLKNQCQIQHTRHRSLFNFAVNLLAGIIAYSLQPVKPSISLQYNS